MTAHPYDVKFTVGANEYGFMLASPPGMSKTLNFEEAGRPDTQRVTTSEVATHQDFEPGKDTPFAMGSWAGGLGHLEFTPDMEDTYWWGTVVTQVPGKVFLPPPTTSQSLPSGTTAINGFYTWLSANGTRYDWCWAAHRLYRRNASTSGAWEIVYADAGSATITDFKIFQGNGFIAVPGSSEATQDYVQIDNANLTAAAPVTTSNKNHTVFSNGSKPKYFQGVRSTFYALVDTDLLFFNVDPTDDTWIGPVDTDTTGTSNTGGRPGDGNTPYQGMRSVADFLMVFTQAAGYNVDSGQDVSEVLWQWKDRPSPANFKYTASAEDMVFYSAQNEVYAYEPASGTTVPLGLSRFSGFSVKEIHGVAADGRYVFVLAKIKVPTIRSADSEALLVCYRNGPYRWSPQCWWEDTNISSDSYAGLAAVPIGSATRLYWGLTTGGATSTVIMDIPAEHDFSAGSSFATSGELYCSIARSGFPGFAKHALWTSMEANNLASTTHTIAIKYSTNMGASYTTLSTVNTDDSSTSYDDVTSRSIALRFTLTGTSSVTPVLRSFDHHQRVRFRYLPMVTMGIRIADHLELLGGGRASESKEVLVANLETLRTNEGANWVQYEDFIGSDFPCTVDIITYRPSRHELPVDEYELEALVVITRADKGA